MSREKQTLFVGQFRKTKLCRFHETGRCRYAEKCPFAHSPEELEDLPDLRKTSICKNWQNHCCKLSADQCTFAHGKEELRKTPPFGRKRPPQVETVISRKDSFEGSDAYASTSDGYRSGSYMESDRQSSSSFEDEPMPTTPAQLIWDPLGLEVPSSPGRTLSVPSSPGHTVSYKMVDERAQGLSMRSFESVAVPSMMGLQRPDVMPACMIEGQMVPAMNQFVLVPAPVYFGDAAAPYSSSAEEIERLLKQAQPTHYED